MRWRCKERFLLCIFFNVERAEGVSCAFWTNVFAPSRGLLSKSASNPFNSWWLLVKDFAVESRLRSGLEHLAAHGLFRVAYYQSELDVGHGPPRRHKPNRHSHARAPIETGLLTDHQSGRQRVHTADLEGGADGFRHFIERSILVDEQSHVIRSQRDHQTQATGKRQASIGAPAKIKIKGDAHRSRETGIGRPLTARP